MKPYTINTLQDIPQKAKIAIYGAGEIGVSLLLLLKKFRSDVTIVSFIDTFKEGNLHGTRIIKSTQIKDIDSRVSLIIVATFSFKEQIVTSLKENNLTNYCFINPLFNTEDIISPLDSAKNKLRCSNTLYAFYDRSVCPDGFDILPFLFLAEVERIRVGCENLHPVIVPPPNNYFVQKDEKVVYNRNKVNTVVREKATSSWWERNIIVPCCWFLSSCKQITICTNRQEANLIHQHIATSIFPINYKVQCPTAKYSWIEVIKATKEQTKLPTLQATEKSLDYIGLWIQDNIPANKKIIAITLRESPFQNDRNSNINEWIGFAENLDKSKYCPVFLRDTSVALTKPHPNLNDFIIFQEASWNMELRMAIYESSFINMFTGGGPAILALFNKKTRLIMFQALRKGVFEISRQHLEAEGIPVGRDYPGATSFQRTIWQEEKADIMRKEFDKMVLKIETNESIPKGSDASNI